VLKTRALYAIYRRTEKRGKELVRAHFPLTPKGMIRHLDLLRPIFQQTAVYGHFGRGEEDFTWEKTDKARELRKDAGLS